MTTVILYKASDGTLFETQAECEAYENRFAGMSDYVALYDSEFAVIDDQLSGYGDAMYIVLTNTSALPWLEYICMNSGSVDPPTAVGTWMIENNAYVNVDDRIEYYQNIKNSIGS